MKFLERDEETSVPNKYFETPCAVICVLGYPHTDCVLGRPVTTFFLVGMVGCPHKLCVPGWLPHICLCLVWLKLPWRGYAMAPCSSPRSWTISTATFTGGGMLFTLTASTRGERWWVSWIQSKIFSL